MLLRGLCVPFAFLIVPNLCADILVILPFPQYSHTMPFMPIMKELGARGHNLTLITPFKVEPNPTGFNQLKVNLTDRELKGLMKPKDGPEKSSRPNARGILFQLGGIFPFCTRMSPIIMDRVVPLLPPPGSKFDLIVAEPFFCMEPLLATSYMYNAPIVATLPMPLFPTTASVLGNPLAISYFPITRIPYTSKMTFMQRVWNTIVNVVDLIGYQVYHIPLQDKIMREKLNLPELPHITDLFHNISLVMTETHFSLSYPRPYMKNVLEVGGVSVQLAKPLSEEWENFMNEAKDGVIFFSWGSHMEMDDADKSVQVMMKAFSKLKQKVLFKWHTNIPYAPENVLVKSWFPQPSILAHNNTVLFISHCGLNSMYEAAYHGIPVLATPFFADQPFNTLILENLGMAVQVDSASIDDGISFPAALDRILSDPSFRKAAEKQSRIIRDRPMDVVKEAAYWIEYIIRHGGSHFQPITRRMPWYSIALIDVSLFLIAIIFTTTLLIYIAIRFCLKKCLGKANQSVSPNKKSQ